MLQNLLRTLNSFSKTTALLICCCCLGCGNGEKEIDDPDRSDDRPDGDEYEDIEVVDGKVRFYLSESEKTASAGRWASASGYGMSRR